MSELFNFRSPATGAHLHADDQLRRTPVRKSITWHRPCQPRDAHTPARARPTHTVRYGFMSTANPSALGSPTQGASPRHRSPSSRPGRPSTTEPRPTAATRHCTAGRCGELDTFWKAVTEWFDVRFSTPYARVLGDRSMPGAEWFPGATLNYAEHALRAAETRTDEPAPPVRRRDPRADPGEAGSELRRQVGSLAAELRALGVRPGDRVSGYLPNIPQAVTALLATAAVGAVWTSCAPDFGAQRPRPLSAGRTRRALHGRRLPLRRQGARPP